MTNLDSTHARPGRTAGKGVARHRRAGPALRGGDEEARRRAMVVLEVLGGMLTPVQAARALAVSSVRYYKLEQQALEGLLAGCEPQLPGPSRRPEKEFEKLRRKLEKLEQECSRYRALARAAQRAVGLSLAAPEEGGEQELGKGRRRRRPKPRALRVASMLRSELPETPAAAADAPKTAGAGHDKVV